MVSVLEKRNMIKLARMGKLEGDEGLRQKVKDLMSIGFQGEDLDFSDKPYYRSALWESTWRNHEAIVRLLAEKGASITFKDYQDRTPLHEAAFYGYLNLVTFFLEKGHPIECVDKFGHTPLFRAVDGGRHDVVAYLVERKAETNLLDNDNVNTQHVASFGGLPMLSNWLLFHGSWKNRFSIEDGGPVLAEEPSGSPRGEEEEAAETEAGDGPGGASKRVKFTD
eukprot:TRINITY_DN57135_c0_g1_i1.p1 TRINITY_DN57135_c0_g1~~TRINITY_DN57135_c0_g1_i1.p1  ORF type:complete len:223 (-),score=38.88 TRINITY_DN57135_c0_g1_i1:98-766(-)